MNYSQVGIANLALGRIGARGQIASINENSPNAIKVLAVWDMIFQEVLSERDWRFAKIRAQLAQSTVTPIYGWNYAYALPSDFLRLVKPRRKPIIRNAWYWISGADSIRIHDLPVHPHGFPYVIETLPTDGNKYLLTDYDNSGTRLAINYIRLISDLTQLIPAFVNCLANRLAAELAISVTEDKQKKADMEMAYRDTLNSAEAQNACDDFLADEEGGNEWMSAGRFWY